MKPSRDVSRETYLLKFCLPRIHHRLPQPSPLQSISKSLGKMFQSPNRSLTSLGSRRIRLAYTKSRGQRWPMQISPIWPVTITNCLCSGNQPSQSVSTSISTAWKSGRSYNVGLYLPPTGGLGAQVSIPRRAASTRFLLPTIGGARRRAYSSTSSSRRTPGLSQTSLGRCHGRSRRCPGVSGPGTKPRHSSPA